MASTDDDLIRQIAQMRYSYLQHRFCTAESPMKPEEKDAFRWSHPDAVVGERFFNLVHATCPHCGLAFTCLPRTE